MPEPAQTDLAVIFQAAQECVRQHQEALNLADPINGNHGDHMVEIFQTAVQAARHSDPTDLAAAMEYASQKLFELQDNASARLYAQGLDQFARQFRQHGVALADLLTYAQELLGENDRKTGHSAESRAGSANTLKALVSGLAGWSQKEDGKAGGLDLGNLFELGMAYLQAKQRGGSKAEILADAACTASPLGATPHRYQSGKLAIAAILQAMQSAV